MRDTFCTTIQSSNFTLLVKLEDSKLGLSLGGAHIGTPTCADDMVLMANNEWDLQAMIDITELFASQRRYTLHPTKSCVLHINQFGDDSLSQFHLCGEQMNTVDEVTHLGFTRRSDRRLAHLVEERVRGVVGLHMPCLGQVFMAATE